MKLVFASDELVTNMDLDKKIREYLSTTYPDLEYERLVASATSRMEMQQYLMSRDLSVGILLSSWYYSRPFIGTQFAIAQARSCQLIGRLLDFVSSEFLAESII